MTSFIALTTHNILKHKEENVFGIVSTNHMQTHKQIQYVLTEQSVTNAIHMYSV